MSRAKKWCFTLNNPTDGEKQLLADLLQSEHCQYGVVGRETGDNGTPHLQGFVIFNERKRANQVKALIGNRYHIEVTRGNEKQASDYCKKDGDYDEYGAMSSQGKRTDWDNYKDWILSRPSPPSEVEICLEWPSLYGRYRTAALQMSRLLSQVPLSVQGDPRPWQLDLEAILLADPDDRTVHFRIDEQGAAGKTWFTRYWLTKFPNETQLLRVGKRDDLAHAIDETKKYYFFDCPRGTMEHFQYSVVEQLKDRVVFSPKYDSSTKYLHNVPHVVVFSNEPPDESCLSADRLDIIYVESE